MVEVGLEVPDGANFGVRVAGDSMEPQFHDGQVIWVRQQRSLMTGEIGIFLYDGNAYLKQLVAHEEALAVTGHDPRRFGIQVKELIHGEDGALTGVVTTGGDTLPCQLHIGATGFAGCREDVCAAFGVEADKTVRTAEGSFATGVEKVFAAGDMRRGQSLVVWAIAEGRAVAAEVDEYLIGYTNLVRTI